MTNRTICIGWDAPTTGPTPTHYVLVRFDPIGGIDLNGSAQWHVDARDELQATVPDVPYTHSYAVYAYNGATASVPSLPLYRSFAITDIDIRDNGVVVTFACEPNTTYWLEVSRDEGKTWTEVGSTVTVKDQHSAAIGGDVLVGQEEWYRVWKRIQ